MLGFFFKLNKNYCTVFRTFENHIFSNYNKNIKVSFTKVDFDLYDTQIIVRYENNKEWINVKYLFSTWYISYLPTIFLIALILSTKFKTIKNKLFALIIGFFLLNLMIQFSLVLTINILEQTARKELGDFIETFKTKILSFLYIVLIKSEWNYYLHPLLAWIIVSFSNYTMFSEIIKSSKAI